MHYRHLIEGCFAERIGTGGVSTAGFTDYCAAADAEHQRIRQTSEPEMMAVLALPEKTDDIAAICDASERLSSGFTNILVFGTGSSSLGARTLCSLAPNTTPKLYCLENVDPSELDPFFDQLDPARTSASFVSKSSGTLETLAVSMVVMNWLREGCGEAALGRQTIAIKEQNDNPLARLCDRYGIPVMPHDPDIGGQHSIFSAVGMLPATLSGLDASAILGGATSVLMSGAFVDGAALAAAMAGGRETARLQRLDALSRQVVDPRFVVPATLGRKPRQRRQRHNSDTGERRGRPAQPTPTLSRWSKRQNDLAGYMPRHGNRDHYPRKPGTGGRHAGNWRAANRRLTRRAFGVDGGCSPRGRPARANFPNRAAG